MLRLILCLAKIATVMLRLLRVKVAASSPMPATTLPNETSRGTRPRLAKG
jgi:hypothetical protein